MSPRGKRAGGMLGTAAVRRWDMPSIRPFRAGALIQVNRGGAEAWSAVKTPVPRLVHDAVRVAARVAHGETVHARMRREPGEGRRGFEGFLRRRFARRADIE